MQTILGSNGVIGQELAKVLPKYTNHIRLVSRKPVKVNQENEVYPADLTDYEQTDKAIQGSEIVYLVIGLQYNTKIWQSQWPVIMANVIKACIKNKAKLVFFDNVYMYDPKYLSDLTETTPLKPVSKKGKVRAEIAGMLLKEIENRNIDAVIVRSADFIGIKNSMIVETVYKNLVSGKSALWMVDNSKVHSFTHTSDAATGTAMIGNTSEAYNQIWHLPTSQQKVTGKQWVELFANKVNTKPKLTVIPKWVIGILGIFMPVMKEFKEMVYQFDRDYYFNSSKFNSWFNYIPLSPEKAVEKTVESLKTEILARIEREEMPK